MTEAWFQVASCPVQHLNGGMDFILTFDGSTGAYQLSATGTYVIDCETYRVCDRYDPAFKCT